MTFSQFAKSLEKLEKTASRLEMTYQLADLFGELDDEEIVQAFYLLQGQLVPLYESLEFNLSVKMIQRALAKFIVRQSGSGSQENSGAMNLFGEISDDGSYLSLVEKKYKQIGDLGLVTWEIVDEYGKKSAGLEILEVFESLTRIARDGGAGSQDRKVEGLVDLLEKVDSFSAKFIVRIVLGKLRLGFSTMTMIDALSWAKNKDKSESKIIEEAYQKKADLGKLAKVYLTLDAKSDREKNLEKYAVEAGVPVVPALCQRLNSSQEIIDKMGKVYAEPKFDGLRVQIHIFNKDGQKQIKAFTRNLEDVSHMFPELETVLKVVKCDTCLLDSEAIGVDPKTGELVSFQKTITRKRKHKVGESAKEVPIRFYAFDLLELDGESLITKPLHDRKELLEGLFDKNEVIFLTEYLVTKDPDELHKFHEAQLGAGLEGAVMKKYDSHYAGGRKGWAWVKIKEEEGTQGKLSDTLDVVVMGYYMGRGKRSQFGLGALLVGVLDKVDQVKTIAKIGTGLTEAQLTQMKELCDNNKVEQKPKQYDVHKNLAPDVWVSPEIVIEVAADELTNSPTHTAGVALRFPRLLGLRADKNWEQITTIKELVGISHNKKS